MRSTWIPRLALGVCLLTPFSFVYGATVHGTVKNGTTGKPAADVEVILIQLQGGMQPVLNSKTDAQGQFTFDYPSIGTQPMLVRAVYRGINFHQPLPPGQNQVQVEVFEPSKDPKSISVGTHFVIFQPNGTTLEVGEEYAIKNDSQPAQAYFRADGNFDFAIPEGASLKQIAAQGPSGMPVVQAPIDRGKNKYSVAYAFRPGENGVRFSYELPYPGNAATVKLPTVYPGARLVLVAPPTVQVTGDGLQSNGQEQGMSLYSRDNLAANSTLTVSVAGTAPPPSGNDSASADSDAGPQNREAQQGTGPASGAAIQVVPGRLDVLKWPIVGGFLCMFALLAILLARRPVVAVAGGPSADVAAPAAKLSKKTASASVASAVIPNANLAEVDAAVGTSLDALKDTLFRLELRRQAGTISEAEYNQERARAEKILRDLVRG
ncbi:MAG TPA: hypothetical protein VKH63_10405 [Candidatus Acidoferrum sp.]|nr:hypothetical protein [Candidatus Acidoferrum sp.]